MCIILLLKTIVLNVAYRSSMIRRGAIQAYIFVVYVDHTSHLMYSWIAFIGSKCLLVVYLIDSEKWVIGWWEKIQLIEGFLPVKVHQLIVGWQCNYLLVREYCKLICHLVPLMYLCIFVQYLHNKSSVSIGKVRFQHLCCCFSQS